MCRKFYTLLLMTCLLSVAQAQVKKENYYLDIYPDTWVATDDVGRVMPTAADTPLKTDKDRTVGIFYITWHTQRCHYGKPYVADVSRVLAQDPNASRDGDSEAWGGYDSFHWGEPEWGYFLSQDEYVIRKDMSMLADAGVDVIIFDVTNAVHYWDEWAVVLRTMAQMKKEGNKVPKFCFWAFNGNVITVVHALYDKYYRNPQYQDLWFYWQGKPLLLYNATPSVDANVGGGEKNLADYSDEVKEFFTLRNMWWGYYEWAGERYVGGEGKWSFGLQLCDEKVAKMKPEELAATWKGRYEQMPVTPAQHPISMVGKSWSRKDGQPAMDICDMPIKAQVPYLDNKVCIDPVRYGIYFQERWDEALQVDPDFIYLNDWNEWTAGKYKSGFDPGGHPTPSLDSFLGRKNPFYFVDQYNAEYNRTIAPMKGGYTDNYYMQMVQNIRRYKGVRPIPENKGEVKIAVDGKMADWQQVEVVYRDTKGDTAHRDHDGYGDLHYTDKSGRNDIVECKVACDGDNLYFYAEVAGKLTPDTDNNWMMLFVDADQNSQTGWHGYDYMVAEKMLCRYDAEIGNWVSVADVAMACSDNALELKVKRSDMNLKGSKMTFDFKWADNPNNLDDVISLCTHGDTAPNRRFNFRYIWKR
ncbi:MAG: hypothetical protein IKY82_00790 [Alistipes sp.]|nr:hypothetical protein [Alistipes sp.]